MPQPQYLLDKKRDQEIISECNTFYTGVIQSPARKRIERQWLENNLFYEGYQWNDFNTATGEYLIYQDLNNGKVKTNINEIEPITMKHVARMVKKKPKIIGRAVAGKESDENLQLISNGFTGLILSWEEKNFFIETLYEWVLEAFIHGIAWMHFYFDPDAGETVTKEVPVFDPNGSGAIIDVQTVEVKLGEIKAQVYNPFDVIISPNVQNYENIRRLQVKCFEHPDEIYEKYGIKVEPDSIMSDPSVFARKYRRVINKSNQYADSTTVNDMVMKIIDFQLPSKKYPKGRYCVYANNVLLAYSEELPFGELMFVPFRVKKRLNKFNGDTFIRQLIPPQRQKNRTLSMLFEILYNHGYPAWLVEKGSGILKKGIKGDSMQIYEYNGGTRPPQQSQPGQAPNYAFQLMQNADDGMMNISSIHDVSRGVNPAGLNNAQALNALMDADDQTISLMEQELYRTIELCGNKLKTAMAQAYEEDRIIEFSGDAAYLALASGFTMKKEWIKQLNDVRVTTEAVPDLPYSRPGKIQLVNDMLKSGLLNHQNPSDMRLAKKIVDFTGMSDEVSLDEKMAMQENVQAKNGMQLAPPEPWEDHAIHLDIHYKFMKTAEFKLMVRNNPQLRDIMVQHTEATKQMIPPPSPPPVPAKLNLQIKGETMNADQILAKEGIIPPPPPPPPMPPQNGMMPPPEMPPMGAQDSGMQPLPPPMGQELGAPQGQLPPA